MLVFDVTTLAARASVRPTGIDRVLVDIALALADDSTLYLDFCAFNSEVRRYERVTGEAVRQMAIQMAGFDGQPTREPVESRAGGIRIGVRPLFASLDRRLADLPETRKRVRSSVSHLRGAAANAAKVVPAYRSDGRRRRAHRSPHSGCFSAEWDADTLYCTLGMEFAFGDLSYLHAQQEERGFSIALMVYDMIPPLAPHFASFHHRDHFLDVVTTCDHAFVISRATEDDVITFAEQHGVTPPQMTQVPLGSSLRSMAPVRPSAVLPQAVDDGFVLAVGTVTARKNHDLLLDVWGELVRERGREFVPPLVIAGIRGSLSEQTMARIEREPMLQGIVFHLQGASDPEIAWLYEHCTFTVYPSLYEGWGLPVTESLDFGKVCIASDRTSLPEAGEGLTVHLDAIDRRAWAEEVMRYWTDLGHRQRHEQRIVAEHRSVTASESAAAIVNVYQQRHELAAQRVDRAPGGAGSRGAPG